MLAKGTIKLSEPRRVQPFAPVMAIKPYVPADKPVILLVVAPLLHVKL